MKIRLAAELQPDSIVDGEGIRTVIWTQGCVHNCTGCHNPETHNLKGGALVDIDDIKKQLDKLSNQTGITLSGGDPLCQIEPCLELAKYAHKLNMNVWCYTGYLYEDLIKQTKTKKNLLELLKNLDILIDGKFDINQRSYDATFRGSKNQRIIDVKKSLKENKVIIYDKLIKKEEIKKPKLYI